MTLDELKARGSFSTILIDPPWRFANTITRAAAKKHYPTMTERELQDLPLRALGAADSHLYLWTTDTHIASALYLMVHWGYVFKQTIVWIKSPPLKPEDTEPRLQIGLGNWWRHSHELCLFGVRGKVPAKVHNLPSVIFAKRTKHSKKPEELPRRIELLNPPPFLEMFATVPRPGWTSWGDGLPQPPEPPFEGDVLTQAWGPLV